jgi:hypothetical protein
MTLLLYVPLAKSATVSAQLTQTPPELATR